MLSSYYTYTYTRPDTGLIFYVGKGSGKRVRSKQRNERFSHIVAKLFRAGLKPYVEKHRENLTEKQALDVECILISQLRALGVPLANMTEGGEGMSGLSPSEDQRKRTSKALKKYCANLEVRTQRSEWMRKRMTDPAMKAIATKNIKICNMVKGRAEKIAMRLTDEWKDPEKREKRLIGLANARAVLARRRRQFDAL